MSDDFGPNSITMAELHAACDGDFDPPDEGKPACRTLFFDFILRKLNPRGCVPNALLLNDAPPELDELWGVSSRMQREHSFDEIIEMAKAELT